MVEESDPRVDALIARLRQMQSANKAARIWMSLLVAVVVLVFIFLGYSSIQTFQREEMDSFALALGEEASELAPGLLEEVNAAAGRLGPAYQSAFANTFAENQELYLTLVSDEYTGLEQYAKQQWPGIEESIAAFTVAQEDTARAALSQYISEDQLTNLSESYRAAMQAYLDNFFAEHYGEKLLVAENIVNKLNAIAETETDMPPEDSQYVIGMMFELLGLEMQANSDANL